MRPIPIPRTTPAQTVLNAMQSRPANTALPASTAVLESLRSLRESARGLRQSAERRMRPS